MPFLSFLLLPPKETWRKPGFLWARIIYGARPDEADGYIYYLCASFTFWAALVFCEFLALPLHTNTRSEMIEDFLTYAPRLLYCLIIPYFVLCYRVNISPRMFDVMHGKIDPRWPRFSGGAVGVGLIGVSLIYAYQADLLYYFLSKGIFALHPVSNILTAALTMSFMLAIGANLGLFGVMALWKSCNLP